MAEPQKESFKIKIKPSKKESTKANIAVIILMGIIILFANLVV